MVPYVGDLAKLGKLGRYAETIHGAIASAQSSQQAAAVLNPILSRLARILDLMPQQLPLALSKARDELQSYVRQSNAAAALAKNLPDISGLFHVKPRWREGDFEYEQISGRLGVPGKVKNHRDPSAQTPISQGTGDHAGHRIGVQFGAPGDASNIGLQNANINTFAPKALQPAFQGSGGSYHRMESEWASLLKQGWGVEVKVKDRYRRGDNSGRPISRLVEWVEISPDSTRVQRSLEFLNTTSPQSRAAAGSSH